MIRPRSKPRPGRLKGKELEALRTAVYERDKGICQNATCGKVTGFLYPSFWADSYHMAHIRNRRMFGDSLDNCRVLCGKCHRDSHQGTIDGNFNHGEKL